MHRLAFIFCLFISITATANQNSEEVMQPLNAENKAVDIPQLASVKKWKQMGDENEGIQIYRGDVVGSKYDAFKGVMTVEAELKTLVAMFQDTKRMPEWMYTTASIDILEQISATESIRYLVNDLPYPGLKDRDVVVHTKLEQMPDKSVVIRMVKKAGVKSDVDGKVRIPNLDTTVVFKPVGSGKVLVEYMGHIEPGGIIMSFTYNLLLKDTPLNTLNDFRNILKEYASQDQSQITYVDNFMN